jgi:hypothetical protein
MASTAVVPAGKPNANRPHAANIYKPAGVKPIQTGIPWVSGGSTSVTSKVDLQLPIRGFRLVFSGRYVIGTANFTSAKPEGLLNLISNITIDGTNSRQNGNVTLWDIDLATLFTMQHLHQHRAGIFTLNGASVPVPGSPFPTGYFNPATGTYDFRIVIDLPSHPFLAGPGVRPGYLIREEEWADSIQVAFAFGSQPATAEGSVGTGAGTSTLALTSYGSGAGSPTIDLYSLPVQMGGLKDSVLPGICSRVQKPLTNILQSAGNGVTLLQLQKQRSSRFYIKTGTAGTFQPAFTTLDDSNLTAVGLATGGGSRNVKQTVDIQTYKQDTASDYHREAITGYVCLDFLQSGNPDSSFPAQSQKVVGAGATFELDGDVVGEANGYGIVIQEQITHLHSGALYNY